MIIKFLIVGIIIYIKSIFTSAETAFTYLRKAKIDHISKGEKVDKKTKRIKEILDNKIKLFGTTKIGMTLAELFASAFAAEAFVNNMAKSLNLETVPAYIISVIIVTVILSYFTLVFGELIPKRLARSHPERTAYRTINVIYAMSKINYIFEKILIASENFFIKMLGLEKDSPEKLTEREIKLIIAEGKDQGIYDETEKKLLYNALKFDNLKAKDIMKPKEKVTFLNVEKTNMEMLEEIAKKKYTRIPVYEKNKDNIIGILHIKDIVIKYAENKEKEIDFKNILREPIYVEKNDFLYKVFREMTLNKKHIAIVKEESKVIGIVTMEDILEKIVGNIYDEFETDEYKT